MPLIITVNNTKYVAIQKGQKYTLSFHLSNWLESYVKFQKMSCVLLLSGALLPSHITIPEILKKTKVLDIFEIFVNKIHIMTY